MFRLAARPSSRSAPRSLRAGPRLPLAAACLCLAALASPHAGAQAFVQGEMFLYSPTINGLSSVDGAIVRVDPLTGTASLFVDTWTTLQAQGAACYDPYRKRLAFSAGLTSQFQPVRFWFADGSGTLQDAGFANVNWSSLVATGDGRIYFRSNVPATPLQWLDAANRVHTLLDATGTAPYLVDGNGSFDVRGLAWDAGTNALFAASYVSCPGGNANRVTVRRLPLSADGTRVSGAAGCAEFDVSSSGETPVGWSRAPGGMLGLVVDTNSNAQEPRMLLVDPSTLAISAFASNGSYTGAAATNAGSWSAARGEFVILDTFSDLLRAFGAGQVGNGTQIPTTYPVSAGGSSGEGATLVEVESNGCAGAWVPYGPGLAGKGGFVPGLSGGGCPVSGGAITLQVDATLGGATGNLFVGLAQAALPFKGGTFLVDALVLNVQLLAGGAPGAAGAGSLALPGLLPADPVLHGLPVYLQCGFADPAAAKGASLSNGLAMEIG